MANIFNYGRLLISTINRRLVSTTKNLKDTTASVAKQGEVKLKSTTKETKKEHKDWISYGFDYTNKVADRNALHSIFFGVVTICFVCGGYYLAYMPDFLYTDWAQREAFLELRRRERNGLPLIDPNLIDPSTIILPSDEELGDTEIII